MGLNVSIDETHRVVEAPPTPTIAQSAESSAASAQPEEQSKEAEIEALEKPEGEKRKSRGRMLETPDTPTLPSKRSEAMKRNWARRKREKLEAEEKDDLDPVSKKQKVTQEPHQSSSSIWIPTRDIMLKEKLEDLKSYQGELDILESQCRELEETVESLDKMNVRLGRRHEELKKKYWREQATVYDLKEQLKYQEEAHQERLAIYERMARSDEANFDEMRKRKDVEIEQLEKKIEELERNQEMCEIRELNVNRVCAGLVDQNQDITDLLEEAKEKVKELNDYLEKNDPS